MSWAGMDKQPPLIVKLDQDKYNLLKELAEDNEYWASALEFVDSVKNRDFYSLTDKQADWLTSIMAALSARVHSRMAEKVFGVFNEG